MRDAAQPDSRWLTGEPAAFGSLMRRHGGMVVTLAKRYARDEDELADLTQEIWIQVYRKRHSYEERGSLLAWILAVGKNVCMTWKRTERRYEGALDRYAVYAPPTTEERVRPVEEMDQRRRAAVAVDALAMLPYRQREAITYRLLEGLSPTETARRMGCKKGTIRSLLRNGLSGIRSQLEASDEPMSEG